MRHRLVGLLVAALGCALALPAHAEFRCAAEARAGFAERGRDDAVTGPAVALCRKLADQVVGAATPARLILIAPDTGLGLPEVNIAFLSPDMIGERKIVELVTIGPAVFHEPISLMVPERSTLRQPHQMAGRIICLIIGGDGQVALESELARLDPPPIRLSFREADELRDAYNVGRCEAAIGRLSELKTMQLEAGINQIRSRVLPTAVGDAPIFLVVPQGSAIRLDSLKLP